MEFYATIDSDSVREYMPDVPVLLPASSWHRKGLRAPNLPAHVQTVAADCGGFVATFKWGGQYPYTLDQYVGWLRTFTPQWSACMDLCMEPEITEAKRGIIAERQQQTTRNAWQAWTEYKRVPWCWVPTVQGWEVDDYVRHARELKPLIDEMRDYYGTGSPFRVGVGTLCRRASAPMIRSVASAVSVELPGVPLHLWGIKLSALQDRVALPEAVISMDSAAWSRLMYSGRQDYHDSGLTQRRYIYKVAMPRYLAKVDKALKTPKQLTLLSA